MEIKTLTHDTFLYAVISKRKTSVSAQFAIALLGLTLIVAGYVIYQLIATTNPITHYKNALVFIALSIPLSVLIFCLSRKKYNAFIKSINEKNYKIIISEVHSTNKFGIYDPESATTTSYHLDFYLYQYGTKLTYQAEEGTFNSVLNHPTKEFYLLVVPKKFGYELIEIYDTKYNVISPELSDLVEVNDIIAGDE